MEAILMDEREDIGCIGFQSSVPSKYWPDPDLFSFSKILVSYAFQVTPWVIFWKAVTCCSSMYFLNIGSD